MGRPRLHIVAAEKAPAPKPKLAFDPARRGYHVAWRPNEPNHCPGCGRSHWYVGRSTAECAFCSAALPIEREVPRG